MADAELTVRISADTGSLDSAIRKVNNELNNLNALNEKNAKSIAEMTAKNGGFAKMVEQSKQSLSEKKSALAQTEKEYYKNTKAINGNISELKKQKKEISDNIKSKKNEIKSLQESNSGLSSNSKAYKSNSKAIADAQRELGKYQKQGKEVSANIKGQYTALQTQKAALEQSRSAVKGAYEQYNNFNKSLDTITKLEKAIKLEETGKKIKDVGENVDTVTKPIQRLAAVTAAGGVAAAKFAIDFEDSFAGVKKTVDGTPEQLDRIRQSIIDMSTKGINGHSAIPQTTKELNELAAAGGQLGIQTENIADFTETMAMLGSATNLSGEEGAKTLARFMNVAGVSQDKIGNLGSAIVDLGNNFATTEAEIADMAMNMGATGAAVGISAQNILAYSTVLSSLGAEAASGGSAISRIWMDIQQAVSEGGSALESFAATSGKSSAEFADSWKKDASGAFRDFIEGLGKSEDIIGNLQELGFNNIRDLQALQKLAGPQGLELLNNALEMSNSAWEENTALQNEFNAKSETTASQLAVTKNNLIEAGRAVGETLLPAVSGGAVKVKEFAQGIADMSDGQKQALVTTGKWVIGLGATGKATSSVLKGVGNITEAVGKIRSATAAGGVLGKLAPALTSIGAAAPYAAAGIAAVGTAVYVGKKAYDAWYDSQYRWSKGLSDADNNVQKSLDSYKNISKIQRELQDARLIISNPESSQEQVDAAKSKIEEIKALLEREYNLKINSDNSDLDNTVDSLKKLTGNELRKAIADEASMLASLKEKYQQAMSELPKLQERYTDADNQLTQYKELSSEISALGAEYRSGAISQNEYYEAIERTGQAIGLTEQQSKNYSYVLEQLGIKTNNAQKEVDDLKPKIDDLTKAQQDYVNISTSFSNKLTEFFGEQLVQGDFNGAAKTLQRLGKAAADAGLDLQGYSEILTNLARASGMINENQTIHISAEGDVSILEKVEDAANSLNGKSVELSVNADGTQAYATIDGVEYKIASYDGETGEAILTADGSTADMVINLTTGEVRAFSSEEGTATLSAIDNVSAVAKKAADAIKEVKSKSVTITATYTTINKRIDQFETLNGWATPKAKGTQDFQGGLAMINDERGISDPRELVEVNGRGYIFEGRDVILPLPRHSKVYTAEQTRRIMEMSGIPHYAGGKDNEAWNNAKADWQHYIKINNVSAAESLEHWNKMLEQFAADAEVIKEIQEEIAASTRDMWDEDMETMQWYLDMGIDSEEHYYTWLKTYRDEYFEGNEKYWRKATLDLHKHAKEQADALNVISEEYVKLHSALNDWNEIADGPVEAYNRVKERMAQNVADNLYTEAEAAEYLKSFGSDMYDERLKNSENWLNTERSYNAMCEDDYIAGLNRMKAYTEDYYRSGIIDYQKYSEQLLGINQKIMDAESEKVSVWRDSADFYQRQAEVFGWDFMSNDSEMKYWQRRLDAELANASDTSLSVNARNEARRYADEARMEVYKAYESQLDDEISKYRDSIEEMRTALDEQVQALRDSWTVEDRDKDISEVEKQLKIFEGAVTKQGQDKYKSLQDEYTQLTRERQIYELEKRNNDKLDRMEAIYDQMESDKIAKLSGMRDELMQYGDMMGTLCDDTASQSEIMAQSLQAAAQTNEYVSAIIGNTGYIGERLSDIINAIREIGAGGSSYEFKPNIYNTISDTVAATALGYNVINKAMTLFGRR